MVVDHGMTQTRGPEEVLFRRHVQDIRVEDLRRCLDRPLKPMERSGRSDQPLGRICRYLGCAGIPALEEGGNGPSEMGYLGPPGPSGPLRTPPTPTRDRRTRRTDRWNPWDGPKPETQNLRISISDIPRSQHPQHHLNPKHQVGGSHGLVMHAPHNTRSTHSMQHHVPREHTVQRDTQCGAAG